MHKNQHLLYSIIFLFFFGWKSASQENSMHPKNEFRGVWIATVVNIDWPKTSTDNVEKEKADYLEILETYKKLNYNAVIVQVRSVGDAIYPSEFAPWSRFLTGKEGLAPNPYYDALAWMIEQAHNRGFEFHAWLNPYRATFDLNKNLLSPGHDLFKHPEWMIEYGGKYYYNPALPEVQEHLTKVVKEVVDKYDIDAIHFDDYFYPYAVPGKVFNDTASYKKYGAGLSLSDWRRANVSNFVHTISTTIKASKPWVQFGISPFGVWRNKTQDPRGSETQSTSNYDDLYADPMLWMDQKWIDYILPQLYWSMNNTRASYSKLVKWWSENANPNTAIYIGHATYKIRGDGDKSWNFITEIPTQIDFLRTFKNVSGSAYFSSKWFMDKNLDVARHLEENQYKYPALPAPVPNLKHVIIDTPQVLEYAKDSIKYTFTIKSPLNTKVRYMVVYGGDNISKIDINDATKIVEKVTVKEVDGKITFSIAGGKLNLFKACAVSFIDYYANESTPTAIDLKKPFKNYTPNQPNENR
ncbi:glycoside hydrolase family 10 protein [Flavobacterium sp. KACC 22761]|uniref:glycoside hydrolase family 10 protein n=1 Tax=Flavobacterium sp. KACC 22761 TaxID=3092665 RepID=UPI002A7636BF|nr:family 10 glycosylhydrolase [Flavobacterium sp. KACC 22761]WPO77013.1 family 10 glycosylhydrolase [Flavobacterium sp. KACC 22761]